MLLGAPIAGTETCTSLISGLRVSSTEHVLPMLLRDSTGDRSYVLYIPEAKWALTHNALWPRWLWA